jgi:hypothetical protein
MSDNEKLDAIARAIDAEKAHSTYNTSLVECRNICEHIQQSLVLRKFLVINKGDKLSDAIGNALKRKE